MYCTDASRACPTRTLDVLSPSHRIRKRHSITLIMPVKSPKREKHGHWRMARKSGSPDRFRVDGSSDSSIPASGRPTKCSICDRAGLYAYALKCRRHSTTTTLTCHRSRRESVPLIRPPLTSPAPACGLAPCCTSKHAAPNMRHLHELACQAHWRRFRRAPFPGTAVLPGSASYCAAASSDMTCTA